ncbi:uncharacterized protein DS421_3g85170 [Arachis hypogaea]|nr:uncharacterized protein DS421_3g85170 [Arachis hypogaea]
MRDPRVCVTHAYAWMNFCRVTRTRDPNHVSSLMQITSGEFWASKTQSNSFLKLF